jgi:pimeloyl-ACP methyl ester carboxylesterase
MQCNAGLQVLSYHGDPRRTVKLAGAVAISGIFDSGAIYTNGVEPHRVPPYDFALFASLAADTQGHWGTLGGHVGQDLAALFKASPWRFYTWHKHVTTHVPIDGKTYGGDVETYFAEVGAYHRECLARVEDPVLCFHARDDPLVPDAVGRTALDVAAQAKGPIIIETNRGGHCGWFEGWLGESWVDALTIEYLKAALEISVTA